MHRPRVPDETTTRTSAPALREHSHGASATKEPNTPFQANFGYPLPEHSSVFWERSGDSLTARLLTERNRVMKPLWSALVVAVLVSSASIASAQEKTVAVESQRKLAALFAQLAEKNCSKTSDGETWECSYRGHGLRQISVRAVLIREDAINDRTLSGVTRRTITRIEQPPLGRRVTFDRAV
jgi:hypothetical protein